jgi:hypothetical protein
MAAVSSLTVITVETPNGVELRASDPSFEDDMAAAEKVMKRYRNALRELAK